jgi:hypothetical protein
LRKTDGLCGGGFLFSTAGTRQVIAAEKKITIGTGGGDRMQRSGAWPTI